MAGPLDVALGTFSKNSLNHSRHNSFFYDFLRNIPSQRNIFFMNIFPFMKKENPQ